MSPHLIPGLFQELNRTVLLQRTRKALDIYGTWMMAADRLMIYLCQIRETDTMRIFKK